MRDHRPESGHRSNRSTLESCKIDYIEIPYDINMSKIVGNMQVLY